MKKRRLQPIGNVVAEIVARKGIGRVRSASSRQEAWQTAVGPSIAEVTRCGEIRRGKLEVVVANSLTMQELTFQKADILAKLRAEIPEVQISDLRFRIGSVAS